MSKQTVLTGIIVEENVMFTLGELSLACGKPAEWIIALVEEGVIEPVVGEPNNWQFRGNCLRRVRGWFLRSKRGPKHHITRNSP